MPFDGNVAVKLFEFLRSRRRSALIVLNLRISAALATIPLLYSSIPFSGRFQVVFCASFVSRREAIIDLYAAMLKDRGGGSRCRVADGISPSPVRRLL